MRRRRRIRRRGYQDPTIKYGADRLVGQLARVHRQQDKIFRERLKAARERAGLSQEEVAERLGRPQYFVSRIETGRRAVEFIELERLAKIYQRSISYFATLSRLPASLLHGWPQKPKRRRVRPSRMWPKAAAWYTPTGSY